MNLRFFKFSTLLPLSFSAAGSALAANVLSNPGFESDPSGQNQNLYGWTTYSQSGTNTFSETGAQAHSGNNYFKVFQSFKGAINYNGIYQDYISGPGATYSADGWAYVPSSDALAGQNVAWLEVTFRDANANILALYRSALINTNVLGVGAFPKNTWVDLPITNQYNPATLAITNTATMLTAPAGTYFARYQIAFQGDAANSPGSVYFDDLSLNQAGGPPYGNWNLVWSDEFNGTTINPNVWTFETGGGGWGNNELEYYTSRTNNAFVADGYLNIVARQEAFGGRNYTSARMKTEHLVSWKYGRFEWRARLPAGLGFWPALWLLGTNISSVGWPKCGEIDVVENKGSNTGFVQGSLHSGSDETKIYNFISPGSVTNFHTYTLDWASNSFLWYVDGRLYETQTNWSSAAGPYPTPFNQPFFMILNLAVGGNYLGNPSTNSINTNSVFPGVMQVDYARIYDQTLPLKISIARTNASLLLSWPSNIVCHLQTQADLPGAGLTSNWTDLNTTTPPVLISPGTGNTFYRLQSP